MRKTLVFTGIVIVVWIAWLAWPLTALYGLARAVEARDATAIMEQIDAPAIRRSLTEQIVDAYSRLTGAKINRSNLIVAVANTIADPLVEKIASPDALAALLQSGWVSNEILARPNDAQGLSRQALGNGWQIFVNSHRGFDQYSISFPANKPPMQQFELEWQLHGLTWRLAAVRLPQMLADKLAQGLVHPRPDG